jgi:hypothetical protein
LSVNDVSKNHGQNETNLSSKIEYRYAAAFILMAATVGSLIIFILSIAALVGVYAWYPQIVAQEWFIYDELFSVFSLLGLAFGISAIVLTLSKRSYEGAIASAAVCTFSGASLFTISLIQPLAVLWQSILYYFLPLFAASLTGTLLIYLQKG